MYEKISHDELYRECPPIKYTNVSLSSLLNSLVIQKNFHIISRPNYREEKGGNEWILLHNLIGTGLYILVWCNVHPTFSRKNAKHPKGRKRHKLKVMLLSMILI